MKRCEPNSASSKAPRGKEINDDREANRAGASLEVVHPVETTRAAVELRALLRGASHEHKPAAPLAESVFSEPTGVPAWKKLPSWAVVATGDKVVGTDAVRSMAERAGATITEVEGSHVIMISRPQVVAETILSALAEAPKKE